MRFRDDNFGKEKKRNDKLIQIKRCVEILLQMLFACLNKCLLV